MISDRQVTNVIGKPVQAETITGIEIDRRDLGDIMLTTVGHIGDVQGAGESSQSCDVVGQCRRHVCIQIAAYPAFLRQAV